MRRLAWIAAALIGLAVAALLALPMIISGEKFRGALEAQLSKSLEQPVKLGAISFRALPPSLDAGDLRVGGEKPLATAREFRVRAKLLAMLQGKLDIASIEVKQPVIDVGQWKAPSHGSGGGGTPFTLDRLTVEDGQVIEGRNTYSHIGLRVDDFGKGDRMPVEVSADIAPGKIAAKGVAGPESNFDGKVTFDGCSLAALMAFAQGGGGLPLDGKLTGTVDLNAAGGATKAKGKLELGDAVARGHKLGYPVSAEFQVDHGSAATKFQQLDVRLGRVAARVTGAVRPDLDLRAEIPSAAIGDLARLASSVGVAFAPGMDVKGMLAGQVLAKGAAKEPVLTGNIRLSDLEISGGEVKQPVRTPALELELTADAVRSKPFEVVAGATKLEGYFSVAKYATAPSLEAMIWSENSNVTELVRMAKAWGVKAADGVEASGQTNFRVRAHGGLGKGQALNFSGTLGLREASLQPASLTKPLKVHKADVKFEADSAAIEKASLSLGSSHLEGQLRVRNFSKPQIEFQLAADKLAVAELRELSKPGGKGSPQGGGAVPALSAHGDISIGTLVLDSLTLAGVKAAARLENGVLALDPVTAAAYAGKLAGTITADLRTTPSTIKVRAKMERVDSAQLLSAVTPLKQVLTGPMGADAQLELSPKAGEDAAKSMNGTISFRFSDGKFLPLSMLGEVGRIAQFLKNKNESERSTGFMALTGDLEIRNGVADTQNLKLETGAATITAAGRMNLVDQTLSMKMLTTMNRSLSDEAGGSRIGGYLTAAVTNNKGELVIPSIVTGTFARPLIAPDAAQVAKLKLQYAVPELTKAPGAIIDAIKGNKEGVRGIIDVFGGKKKQ
ncbi:MAG: AsmA-like C-terminal region-containing protein [Bryobacteraceae bacterium]